MKIDLSGFTGLVPRLNAEALPDNASALAQNTNFNSGTITGVPQGVTLNIPNPSIGILKGGFVYTDNSATAAYAYSWTYDVDAVRSPTIQDIHKRFYWTGKNGSTKEFKFGLIGENTNSSGGSITTAYKVGVINSTLWQNTMAELGIGIEVRKKGIPVSATDVTTLGFRYFVTDESGTRIHEITDANDDTWVAGQGAVTKGWYKSYLCTLPQPLDAYTEKTVSAQVFTAENRAISNTESGGATYQCKVWKDTAGAIKFIEFIDLRRNAFPEGLAAGDTVEVWDRTDGNNAKALGTFYWDTPNSVKASAFNVALLGEDVDAPVSGPASFALEWSFTYQGQTYAVTFHENKDLSGSVDVFGGITGSLVRTTSSTFTATLDFGFDLPIEVRSYIMTFVNKLGEESEPSLPVEIQLNPGKEEAYFVVNTTTWNAAIAALDLIDTGGVVDRYALHGCRIYRTASASDGTTDFLYTGTIKFTSGGSDLPGDVYAPPIIDGTTYSYADTQPAAGLGAACPTQGFIANTNDLQDLQGLTAIHNNMLAAFKNNEIYICEPGMPWAYRTDAIKQLPHKVVALIAHEQGFYALTDGVPYYFSGDLPENMQGQRLTSGLPCLNKRAAASTGGRVFYLSSDGIVNLNGLNPQLDPAFSREVWRASFAVDTTIQLITWGHRILGYWPGQAKAWVFDIDDGNWSELTYRIDYALNIPSGVFGNTHDEVVFSDGVSQKWIALAQNLTTTSAWARESKTFTLPKPVTFGVLQAFGSGSASFVLKCYLDLGETIPGTFIASAPAGYSYEYSPTDKWLKVTTPSVVLSPMGTVLRLPGGFMSNKWSVKAVAAVNTTLTRVVVATSPSELANG